MIAGGIGSILIAQSQAQQMRLMAFRQQEEMWRRHRQADFERLQEYAVMRNQGVYNQQSALAFAGVMNAWRPYEAPAPEECDWCDRAPAFRMKWGDTTAHLCKRHGDHFWTKLRRLSYARRHELTTRMG